MHAATPLPEPCILQDVYTSPEGEATQLKLFSDHVLITKDGAERSVPLGEADALAEDIRAQIAKKIALLVPPLSAATQGQLVQHVFHVLKTLAKDQAVRVRRIIAEELRNTANAPPELIQTLAWDDHAEVQIPILEYSPLLKDVELLEIIERSGIPEVVEAIARRRHVSENVSAAIVESNHTAAISTLISNNGAAISEDTFEHILDKATEHQEWLELLAARQDLTVRTLNRIASFVSQEVMGGVENTLPADMVKRLRKNVTTRLKDVKIDRERNADARAKQLFSKNLLTADEVSAALDKGDVAFVHAAMALLAGLPKARVERIFAVRHAKTIVALSHKAGLPMRLAITLQLKLGRVHPTELINARGGFDYPLTVEEMSEYLDHFGDA